MIRNCLFAVLLHCSLVLFGQENKHIVFDSRAFSLSDSIASGLAFGQAVQEMNRLCETDTQKLWLLAGWFYKNIDFDVKKFEAGGEIGDYKSIFNQKKGICGDYATLFSEFCNRLKITNEIIEGYVPEYGLQKVKYDETNHAWNVVKLGDNWYHCDVLGFSGYIKQSSSREFEFVKQPQFVNFLTQEFGFLVNHIPADPMWQLSDYPIPLDTLLQYGIFSKVDSGTTQYDYKNRIEAYLKLSKFQKQLVFADNALKYNRYNHNIVAINYYNAAIILINSAKNDKEKLRKSKSYLTKAKNNIDSATYDVKASLKPQILKALDHVNKSLP